MNCWYNLSVYQVELINLIVPLLLPNSIYETMTMSINFLLVVSHFSWYNALTRSLNTSVLVPLSDVSCSRSGSPVDPPVTPPGVRGMVSPEWSSSLSWSLKGSISVSAIFDNPLRKDDELQLVSNSPEGAFSSLGPTILLLKHGPMEAMRVSRLEGRYNKKHEKCSKTFYWLLWLNACSSSIGMASGLSSVHLLVFP